MALEPPEAGSDFVILDSDGLLAYLDDALSQHDVYQALTGVLHQRLEVNLPQQMELPASRLSRGRRFLWWMLPPRL